MTCEETREQFSAWVDQALSPREREQVAAHLAACADCPRELDRFARTVALLAGVERPCAPVGFVDRVMGAVRREPWPRRALRLVLGSRPQVPVSVAATAAIATLSVYLYQSAVPLQMAARHLPSQPVQLQRIEPLTPVPVEPGAVERPLGSGPTLPSPGSFRSPAPPSPRTAAAPPAPPAAPPRPAEDSQIEMARRDLTLSREQVSKQPAAQPPKVGGDATTTESEQAKLTAETRGATEHPPAPPAARSAPRAAPPPEASKEQPRGGLSSTSARARVLRAPDLAGRLAAPDRATALGALDRLAADVGATDLGRRQDGDATVVDLMVPRAAYDRIEPALRAIGAWTRDAAHAPLPEMVHVSIRLTAP